MYISQYPLEDILDKFYTHISDFYEDLNKNSNAVCNVTKGEDGQEYEELVIDWS